MPRVGSNRFLPIFILSLCKTSLLQNLSELIKVICEAIDVYGPNNPASLQLAEYAHENPNRGNYTMADGSPVHDNLNVMTAGLLGPVLLEDSTFLETIQHLDRERIPERLANAKGTGAFGYFLCTNDLSEYTQASVLTEVGKKTPVAVRFSRLAGNLGEADTLRDSRGFSIKFYTEQGNWDLLTVNTPFFWIRDPMRFPDLMHAVKRNPVTNLYDPVMFWDFATLLPETLPMLLSVFSDRGIPVSYRTMDGHSVNVYVLTGPDRKETYVKFNLQTNQGIHNIPPDEAATIAGIDPDIHTRDLYNSIAKGDFPSWNVSAELLTPKNADKVPWDPFDPTKIWPADLTNSVQLGILVLDRNPSNHFAQVEQMSFDPARLVPGIEPSRDRILQGRLFSYSDAAMHRLGVNHELLPVNRPVVVVENSERDGPGRIDDNQGGAPNYFPNSFSGVQGNPKYTRARYHVSGLAQSYNTTNEDNFSVPSIIWQQLTDAEKSNIAKNIVQTLSLTPQFIQERALNNFYQVSSDLGNRVTALLNLP